ncbi:MAG: beta-lactamase family protein [Bacteroidota bacterium]|nr:beta-lactamase family protein [Bacteroidota bacterium]
MTKLILLSITLFCGINLFAQKTDSESIIQRIDRFLSSAHTAGKFNGTAIIAQKGNLLLNKGYGYKDVSFNFMNDSSSIYQIGSVTKSFTAVIILKLAEQGKLALQDKVNKFLPGYPQGDKISIQNLLNHTSGIYNYTNDIDDNDTAIVCYPVSKDRVLDVFKNKPLAFKPGKYFQYCNSGYFLLGMVIEKVTGMPYQSVVRQMIFTPLQMNHSGFDFKNLKSNNKTQGYVLLNKGSSKTNYTVDSTVYFSAGSMYSTTHDMLQFAKAISRHELLNDESWNTAFTPGKGNYGYGFWIKNTIYGKRYITHDGGLLGYTSDFAYFPDDDISIILLSNTGNYSSNLSSVSLWLSAIVYKIPYSNWIAQSENFTNDSTELVRYTGSYTFGGRNKMFLALRDGRLVATENSEQSAPEKLTLLTATKLYFNDFNIPADFIKDDNGKVVKLIIHQIGKDIECRKD